MPAHAWGDRFQPFSATHALVILAFALFSLVICALGRGAGPAGGTRERKVGSAVGWLGALVWMGYQAYWLSPSRFEWSRSLPLHLCDIAGFVAPVALLTQARVARALLYFWGFALCSEGLLTPILTEGPSHAAFWLFFASHFVITGSALYDAVVRGFRPSGRDLRCSMLITLTYCLSMFGLALITDWNYAYMGRLKAPQPTLLDLLGPWPWRVPVILIIGAAAFVAVWLPWRRPADRPARREDP